MSSTFHTGACLDLGAFDPAQPDCGVNAFLARAQHLPAWVVLMEDRQPVFFHGYTGFDPAAPAPLNRHGPRTDAWTHGDVKRLVEAFHVHGVSVLLGYWIHECDWVDERHPELLIRDATGRLWMDRQELNADFSPMRRLRADPEHGIAAGERYATFAVRRYRELARDFGFDGLFLGDGAMGFRRHGKDWKDLRNYDYHEDWLAEFVADHAFEPHGGCALADAHATTPARAADVHAHHWDHWVAFNTSRWTDYYRAMADGVHAAGGILAAYNCMNYDPALARLHGVDYRGIAEAGLDILVFQAYDYAWGPLGPFGELHIAKKDLRTNLETLLRTRAHVGHDTPMQIVVTVETEDEVEGWNSPDSHTLGELYHYGAAVTHDGRAWRRAADGTFVVWGNSVSGAEWGALAAAAQHLSAPPPTPAAARLWAPDEVHALAARGVPTERAPEEIYAYLDAPREQVGEGPATHAMLTTALAAREAPLAEAPPAPAKRLRVA